ncbi:MAG TPA: hypothetical protein O0X42_02385 [Methanocorpusculum sp.]|nr:hypothetical protein [Methanocorpusculum sp.]
METAETVSPNGTAPVEKAGLSVVALITSLIGLIVTLFHCLGDFPSVVASLTWIPTSAGNPGLYWGLLIIGAILLISGCIIAERLKKKGQGIASVNKVTLAFAWVFCAMILISLFLPGLLGL